MEISAFQPSSGTADARHVSVIVPVHNGAKRIEGLLAALEAQTYPCDRFEVLIVDNRSDDGTADLVRAYAPRREFTTRLIFESERQGSYAARNKGVTAASGSILAFTDADCLPTPDWIASGVAALGRHSVDQIAGAVEITFAGDRPNLWEYLDDLLHLKQEAYVNGSSFGATANLFVRADALRAVGGFRSDMRSGGDFEFGQRMKRAGCTIAYAPEALVRHPARASHAAFMGKIRRVAIGVEALSRLGLAAPLGRDDIYRRRIPDPVLRDAELGWAKRHLIAAALNYVHYARVYARLRASRRMRLDIMS